MHAHFDRPRRDPRARSLRHRTPARSRCYSRSWTGQDRGCLPAGSDGLPSAGDQASGLRHPIPGRPILAPRALVSQISYQPCRPGDRIGASLHRHRLHSMHGRPRQLSKDNCAERPTRVRVSLSDRIFLSAGISLSTGIPLSGLYVRLRLPWFWCRPKRRARPWRGRL